MIIKATELKNDFMGYVKKTYHMLSNLEDSRANIFKDILKDSSKLDNLDVVLEGSNFIAVISYEIVSGIKMLYPIVPNYKNWHKVEDAILQNYEQPFVVVASDMSEKFQECHYQCSFNTENEYSFEGYNSYFVPKTGNKYLFRDVFETERFPEFDINNITLKTVKGSEVNNYLIDSQWKQYPLMKVENGNYVIAGFHYLQPDFQPNHELLVVEQNGKPVAVIKTGTYSYGKYEYVGLNYIDVCEPYRRKGLANLIIKYYAEHNYNESLPFVLSHESEMGQLCRMTEHFKRYMPSAKTRNEFEDECYKSYLAEKSQVS